METPQLVWFHQRENYIDLQTDNSEPIYFNFGMLIWTNELHILLPIWMNLATVVCEIIKKIIIHVHLLTNFSVDFDETEYAAITHWFVDVQARFVSPDQHSVKIYL